MIQFAWPYFLFLLPVPLIIFFILPKQAIIAHAPLKLPFYQQCNELTIKQHHSKKNKLALVVFFLIWISLVVAAARPQWLGNIIKLPNNGRDLMLAIDISGSMKTTDLQWQGRQTNRLSVVKGVLKDFINKRKGDRIGLILFGSKAYQLSPLTMAINTTQKFLQESMIGMAGNQTAIGDAIGLAIKRLMKRKSKQHVLILITDGVNTAGKVTPLSAAKLAAKYKIKIYTIGVGANEMIVNGFFGPQRYNPSESLDEKTLKKVAQITKGQYFRATNTKELKKIYSLIDKVEKIKADPKQYRPIKELYIWPLSFSYLFSLLIAIYYLINKFYHSRKVTYGH